MKRKQDDLKGKVIRVTGNGDSDALPVRDNKSRSRLPRKPEDKRLAIIKLLEDDERLFTLEEMLANGASFSTVSAALDLAPSTLTRWLAKGQKQRRGPYAKLRRICLSAASKSKYLAEAKLLDKSPERWLERSTTVKALETSDEAVLSSSFNRENSLALGADAVLRSLSVMRAQGIDINALIDRGELSLNVPNTMSPLLGVDTKLEDDD